MRIINTMMDPCGMLDRDPRTILTIHRQFTEIGDHQHQQSIKFYPISNRTTDDLNYEFNSNKHLISIQHNFKRRCKNFSIYNIRKRPAILEICDYEKPVHNKFGTRRHKCLRIFKLNSLLLCIFFWIVFLQRTTNGRPLPRHIMQNSNNGDGSTADGDSNHHQHHHHHHSQQQQQQMDGVRTNSIATIHQKRCHDISDIIKNVGELTEHSYKEIFFNQLNNYTRKISNHDHLDWHQQWKESHFDILNPEEGRLAFDNYHENPPVNVFQHLFDSAITEREKTERELINLYKRLKIIELALFDIIQIKQNDGNFRVSTDPQGIIMKFFMDQKKYATEVLLEIELSLRKLNIAIPHIHTIIDSNDKRRGSFDWITTREHLKLLVYATEAYKILLRECQHNSN